MFESAELGHSIDDTTYEAEVEKLRVELLAAQRALLADARFPVIVLVNGVEGAGKGETVNLLHEWLDPRHVRSVAFDAPDEAARMRPKMWRYWEALPPKGKIGILFGSWYTDPIAARVEDKHHDVEGDVARIRAFEKLLVEDGAVLVKLWFHLSKKAQKKRFDALEKDKLTSWKVTPEAWHEHERYAKIQKTSARILRETSTGTAPWIVIDGRDANYRALTAGRTLLAAIRARLAAHKHKKHDHAATPPSAAAMLATVDTTGILENLPFTEKLSKADYEAKHKKAQAKLGRLSRSPKLADRSVVLVFEGVDAAGKGGAIRRVTQAIDARRYDVVPIAAPAEYERAYPYLWRFWHRLPAHGRFVIFDRSWYGRVLVERVEGFASDAAWSRAYEEIVDFERQLVENGAIVLKFWLAITKEEQRRRFVERQKTERKQFKLTEEDWRNRQKWREYVVAASEMIDRTSTDDAPWTVVEANDKHLARVKVLETIVDRLSAEL